MRATAFTLIEMLIVMSIIALLAGMLMTFMKVAGHAGKRTATESVMRKVETALKMFKTDYKAYPWQAKYPDPGQSEGWTNRLYYHLGTDIADADRQNVIDDCDAAAAQYNYDCTNPNWRTEHWPPVSKHVFVTNRHDGQKRLDVNNPNGPMGDDIPTGTFNDKNKSKWFFTYDDSMATCAMLNRMGQERARLLMLIGDVEATGVTMTDVNYPGGLVHPGRLDPSITPLLGPGVAKSAAKPGSPGPGWATDYLQGALERRYIRDQQILDAWGHPLVYIYQVEPGVRSTQARPFAVPISVQSLAAYGLAGRGRMTLNRDAVPDPDFCPDPINRPMHSDMTKYAAPGLEFEFELWSAGPDGRFNAMRDAREDRDNIPCAAYDRGIPK